MGENGIIKAGESFRQVIEEEGEGFGQAIGRDGMAENREKAVHLLRTKGVGSRERGNRMAAEIEGRRLGVVSVEARYLGNMLRWDGGNSAFVKARVRAIHEAFCSLGGALEKR